MKIEKAKVSREQVFTWAKGDYILGKLKTVLKT